jgi:hypothetical protein
LSLKTGVLKRLFVLRGKATKNVAILIFDEVEVLDFCGPFEVFSIAGRAEPFERLHGRRGVNERFHV